MRQPDDAAGADQPEQDETTLDTGWGAEVLEVSSNGVRLLLGHRVTPGTELVLEPLSDESSWYTVPIQVTNATPNAGGYWVTRCVFKEEKTPRVPPSDRRTGQRKRSPLNTRVQVLEKPSFHSCRAFVRDVSAEGIGLVMDRPLELGTTLAIQVDHRLTQFQGVLSALVRHVTPMAEGTWLVGCSFPRPLSAEEIAALS